MSFDPFRFLAHLDNTRLVQVACIMGCGYVLFRTWKDALRGFLGTWSLASCDFGFPHDQTALRNLLSKLSMHLSNFRQFRSRIQ